MNLGIIYLIQPCELIGTKRYKIGCSSKNNLDRCINGYTKGSRYIYIMECSNPFILKNKIKKNFINKFKLIAGNEYFEGDEDDIIDEFIKEFNDHKKNITVN